MLGYYIIANVDTSMEFIKKLSLVIPSKILASFSWAKFKIPIYIVKTKEPSLNRRGLNTAFLCQYTSIFEVAVLQNMKCYLTVNSKT